MITVRAFIHNHAGRRVRAGLGMAKGWVSPALDESCWFDQGAGGAVTCYTDSGGGTDSPSKSHPTRVLP